MLPDVPDGGPSPRMRSVPPPACGGLCRLKPAFQAGGATKRPELRAFQLRAPGCAPARPRRAAGRSPAAPPHSGRSRTRPPRLPRSGSRSSRVEPPVAPPEWAHPGAHVVGRDPPAQRVFAHGPVGELVRRRHPVVRVRGEDRSGIDREREADEIRSLRDHPPAGPLDGKVRERGVQDPGAVLALHVLPDPVRDDLALVLEVGGVHPRRPPDVFVHVVVEALPGDVLDDPGHDVPGVGGVAVLRARLEQQRVVLEDLDGVFDGVRSGPSCPSRRGCSGGFRTCASSGGGR